MPKGLRNRHFKALSTWCGAHQSRRVTVLRSACIHIAAKPAICYEDRHGI